MSEPKAAPEETPLQTPETLESSESTAPAVSPASPGALAATEEIENGIVEALKTVFDPEIPVNIYELGLVYDIDVQPTGEVKISMTLTSPACPVAGSLPGEVQAKAEGVPGVTKAEIELVWEPAWNPSLMSEAARLQLGMF
jgi:FeS assembly SUF system protein